MFLDINRFHICVFITWQLANFAVGQYIFDIFFTYSPKFKCGNGDYTRNCSVFRSCESKDLMFDAAFGSATVDFKWICNHTEYYAYFFTFIQSCGVLIGTVLFGVLSDNYGRKPIGILVLLIAISASIGAGYAPNQNFLFVTRFCSGLSIAGVLVVICAWVNESILSNQRMVIRGFFHWGWTRFFVTAVCYFTYEWRVAAFVGGLALFPALLMVIFVIPESAIWLHSKGKTAQMIESEKIMAKIAGVPFQPSERKHVHSKTLVQTLKTKGLFKKLSVLWVMWFLVAVCGFANDLNSTGLAGNLYINQALFGLLLVVSKVVLLFVDSTFENFKRRTLHQGSQSVMIACFAVLAVFSYYDYHGNGTRVVYLIGTVFIEYTWDAVYLCTIELMETSSRASATGSCSMFARVGSLLAPVLKYLNTWWPLTVYLTIIVLGILSLSISFLFLKESKNVNLDDVHVDDTEDTKTEKHPMLNISE